MHPHLDQRQRLLQHRLDGLQLRVVQFGQAGHGEVTGQGHPQRLRLHFMAEEAGGPRGGRGGLGLSLGGCVYIHTYHPWIFHTFTQKKTYKNKTCMHFLRVVEEPGDGGVVDREGLEGGLAAVEGGTLPQKLNQKAVVLLLCGLMAESNLKKGGVNADILCIQ